MPVDYYETLGVDRGANDEEIRRAFRRKAMEFHPDRNKTPGAEDKFKEINEAYQVLSDQEKRTRYDRFGHAGVNGGSERGFDGFDPFGGFGDIFDTFFGGGGRTANQPRSGEDISQRVNLTFEEAVFGCDKDIEINRVEPCRHCSGAGNEPGTAINTCHTCNGSGQVRRAQRSVFGQFAVTTPCSSCNGNGRSIETPCTNCRARGFERRRRTRTVTIPAGVDNGMQVRITGEGDAGANGGPPGNLYVQVRVREHPLFVRDESDLLYRTSLNMAEAALGMTKPIPTLEGDDVDLDIPPGTQAGSEFRVRSRGVPRIRRDGRPTDRRGDIRVLVDVDIPSKLNKYQRKLVEDLAYSLANNGKRPPAPQRKKRSSSPKSNKSDAAEPEESPVDAGAEAPEQQSDDKQRGLFDRIKDTLTSSGE
ncbi:MAG: molecular chaperone DnaJ [Chloroflexota bacterium]|nr:molecular chaperone DnaJ [Chloroflexota bacterium]MDE2962049.1 molecular chaperone DnaJ [Chloroflexota bacterium]